MYSADVKAVLRTIKGSVVPVIILLAWDGVLWASFVLSVLACPVWFLLSLLKSAVERPGWGLALVRIAMPAATLGIVDPIV